MRSLLALIVYVYCLVQVPWLALGYGTGASTAACKSMTPDHGRESQNDFGNPNPYKLTFANSSVRAGDWIEIRIEKVANTSLDFKGFMVQAKDEADDSFIGEFDIERSMGKEMRCDSDSPKATISHSNKIGKEFVSFHWRTNASTTGGDRTIRFDFTVVQDYETFWVERHSREHRLHLMESLEPPKSQEQIMNDTGNNTSEGYFGLPDGCQLGEKPLSKCKALFRYAWNETTPEYVDMEIMGIGVYQNDTYTAVGFSKDTEMGGELTLGCLKDKMALYWNTASPNKKAELAFELNTTLHTLDVSIEYGLDGLRTCRIRWHAKTTIYVPGAGNMTLNLGQERVHLMLARGEAIGSRLTYHYDNHAVCAASRDLTNSSKLDTCEVKQEPETNHSSGNNETCHKHKGCFGMPLGCDSTWKAKFKCSALFKYSQKQENAEYFDFEIIALRDSSDESYTAIGFSTDTSMGDDLAIACLVDSITVNWNEDSENKDSLYKYTLDGSQSLNYSIIHEGGGVRRCRFSWPVISRTTASDGVEHLVDLSSGSEHHLMLAQGRVIGNRLQYHHSSQVVCDQTRDLTKHPDKVECKKEVQGRGQAVKPALFLLITSLSMLKMLL